MSPEFRPILIAAFITIALVLAYILVRTPGGAIFGRIALGLMAVASAGRAIALWYGRDDWWPFAVVVVAFVAYLVSRRRGEPQARIF